jgi:hypothetical protein
MKPFFSLTIVLNDVKPDDEIIKNKIGDEFTDSIKTILNDIAELIEYTSAFIPPLFS